MPCSERRSMSATILFATCMDSIVIKIVNANGPDCDGPTEFGKISLVFFSVSFLEISFQFVGERILKKNKESWISLGHCSMLIWFGHFTSESIRIDPNTFQNNKYNRRFWKWAAKNETTLKCFSFVCMRNDMIIGWCNNVSCSFIANFPAASNQRVNQD